MSQVIPFRTVPPAPPADIATLSARLIQVETAETTDEDLLDLLVEAEARAITALARAPAGTLAEAMVKLATVVRRAGDERDGPLSTGELSLLRSTHAGPAAALGRPGWPPRGPDRRAAPAATPRTQERPGMPCPAFPHSAPGAPASQAPQANRPGGPGALPSSGRDQRFHQPRRRGAASSSESMLTGCTTGPCTTVSAGARRARARRPARPGAGAGSARRPGSAPAPASPRDGLRRRFRGCGFRPARAHGAGAGSASAAAVRPTSGAVVIASTSGAAGAATGSASTGSAHGETSRLGQHGSGAPRPGPWRPRPWAAGWRRGRGGRRSRRLRRRPPPPPSPPGCRPHGRRRVRRRRAHVALLGLRLRRARRRGLVTLAAVRRAATAAATPAAALRLAGSLGLGIRLRHSARLGSADGSASPSTSAVTPGFGGDLVGPGLVPRPVPTPWLSAPRLSAPWGSSSSPSPSSPSPAPSCAGAAIGAGAVAATPAPTAPAAAVLALGLGLGFRIGRGVALGLGRFDGLGLLGLLRLGLRRVVHAQRGRAGLDRPARLGGAQLLDPDGRRQQRVVRLEHHGHAEARLDLAPACRACGSAGTARPRWRHAPRSRRRGAWRPPPRSRAAPAARRSRCCGPGRGPGNAGRRRRWFRSGEGRSRWRDISSRPKWLMRPTWMRARSSFSASFSRRSTIASCCSTPCR